MSTGYICLLTLPQHTGSVTLFATEYYPEYALSLLNKKLDAKFHLRFSMLVEEPILKGRLLRDKLNSYPQGQAHHKILYQLPEESVYAILQDDSFGVIHHHQIKPDFFKEQILLESLRTTAKPKRKSKDKEEAVASYESRLALLGRQGCPQAIKELALIYVTREINSLKFKTYWREYLSLSLQKNEYYNRKPNSLGCPRAAFAGDIVEYFWQLTRQGWIDTADIRFVKSLLKSTDRFTTKSFLDILGNNLELGEVKKQFGVTKKAVA